MATQTSPQTFTWEGQQVTYQRYRYLLGQRNQATMKQVSNLLQAETTKVLGVASTYTQQELGGFLRSVVPGLIDKYGNVNAVAAMKYYDDQRTAYLLANPTAGTSTSRAGARLIAQRTAAAQLRGQLYVARMAPQNVKAKAEPIIGYGMQRFTEAGFDASATAVNNALTRAVASFNRDTMLYNSALDTAVVTVQRVAEANACEFCAMMAFRSTKTISRLNADGSTSTNLVDNVRTSSYAVEFHDNCHCSIETLYEGDSPIVPDYYKDFKYGQGMN